MEFHQIRYFLMAAETLNFTRAAEQCYVSQPALTRAIQKLEEELAEAKQTIAILERHSLRLLYAVMLIAFSKPWTFIKGLALKDNPRASRSHLG